MVQSNYNSDVEAKQFTDRNKIDVETISCCDESQWNWWKDWHGLWLRPWPTVIHLQASQSCNNISRQQKVYRSSCVPIWLDWQCVSRICCHCCLIVLHLLICHWIFLLVQIRIVVEWRFRWVLGLVSAWGSEESQWIVCLVNQLQVNKNSFDEEDTFFGLCSTSLQKLMKIENIKISPRRLLKPLAKTWIWT